MSAAPPTARPTPTMRVHTSGRDYRFTESFQIGRGEECEVRIDDGHVSRRHVWVILQNGLWSFRDLNSSNGVFADDQPLATASVSKRLTISLGREGPTVTLEVESPRSRAAETAFADQSERPERETTVLTDYVRRYFDSSSSEPAGRRTMMIRKAFQEIQKKQRRKFSLIVGAVSLAALVAAGYAVYSQRQIARQRVLAEELFYSMKTLDVDIANLELLVRASSGAQGQDQVNRYRARRQEMERNYDRFVEQLYDRRLTEPERLILRVTRLLGECDLAAPPEYLDEVSRYISKWQATDRFVRSLNLARENGYTKRIADEFLAQNLPPQFLYLALQESDFNAFASGPPTYMGIAKGMWQFVPDTGRRYGLNIGPLATSAQADAADDRHNWDKATVAAARYIKDIYSTDAQASGLLVMAGYNWGENRVIRLIQSLSPNPRERNFWQLLEKHRERIPKQTYDYVFYIVSAAVIGENPRMFGFPLDNPLGFLHEGSEQAH